MPPALPVQRIFHCRSPEATAELAARLAGLLRAGDTLLLSGEIGAGKTHFARALISARLAAVGRSEEVPSPTFTLVQTYDDGETEIWHADLYRLTGGADSAELGLADAFGTAICLVEWPDRLGDEVHEHALRVDFAPGGAEAARRVSLSGDPGRWSAALEHLGPSEKGPFSAWEAASVAPLAGDASTRRYHRLTRPGGDSAVLMSVPVPEAALLGRFAAVADHLRASGLSAPRRLATDRATGRMVIEDFGDDLYSRHLDARPQDQALLYDAAVDVLVTLARAPAPQFAPDYGADAMTEAAALACDCYAPGADRAAVLAALREALGRLPWRAALSLRDVHAKNLFWLPERQGAARVGIIDFQDAVACHPAYDLASLLTDARRDVAEAIRGRCIARFAAGTGSDPGGLEHAVAALSVQRNLRILGIFARLAKDGRPGYLRLQPRVWGYLTAALAHPALARLSAVVHAELAGPVPA